MSDLSLDNEAMKLNAITGLDLVLRA